MQFKNSIVTDTRRMDRADGLLLAALRSAGETVEELTPIVTGRTAMDVRCACEALLSLDRTRGRQIVVIATIMNSRMLINFALSRIEHDSYYGLEDRGAAAAAYRRIHESQSVRANGHSKKAK